MKSLQSKIQQFTKKYQLNSPVEHRLLDLVSEIGEVAKEVLKMSNYGRKPLECNDNLQSELGDTLYALITVANTFEIDLEEAVLGVLGKYEKRLEKRSAGSESE